MKGSILIPTRLIGKWRENGIASFAARARPLRIYLILFAVGLALPLLMLSGYFLSRMAALERDQIERGVLQAAEALSWDIDRELDRAIVTLETLSTSEALASGEFDKFHAHATRALRGTYIAILLIDAGSFQQLLNTRVPFGTPLPKTALTEVAREVMRTREPQVSDVFIGAIAKEPIITVEIPVFAGQRVRYLLAMSIDPLHLVDIMKGQYLESHWITTITDSKGIIIARSERHEAFVGKSLPEKSVAASFTHRGVFRSLSISGEPIVRAAVPLWRAGWLVSATVPASYVDASRLLGWRLFCFLLLTALAVGGGLAYFFSRFIARPLAAATLAAKTLGAGHQSEFGISPLAEANTLTTALSETSNALSERSRALSDSLTRFHMALQGAEITVFTQDLQRRFLWVSKGKWEHIVGLKEEDVLPPSAQQAAIEFKDNIFRTNRAQESDLSATINGERRTWQVRAEPTYDSAGAVNGLIGVAVDVTRVRRAESAMAQLAAIVASTGEAIFGESLDACIQSWNPAAERMFGYAPAEVIGRPAAILVPEDRASERETVQRDVRGGQIVSLETVRRTKNGREIQVAINVAPTQDDAGNIIGVCTITHDISERKRREEHTAFLMRELAHRSKNLLAVIKGMATQSARQSDSIEQFQWHFNRRIQGLANSHDLLIRQNWKGAYLRDLIHAQLEVFVDAAGSRVRINGPRVFLEAEAVQSTGLALHELATNASKYGALSNTDGLIRISWRLDREAANGGLLCLSWQELDGPPVMTPTRSGFGRMVIEHMVGRALGGSVALEFPPGGVVCRLQIPGEYIDAAMSTGEETVGEAQAVRH